jgi:hypothetical protein
MSVRTFVKGSSRHATALGAALLVVGTLAAARNVAKESGAFLVTIGRDTLAAESYVRDGNVLKGTSVVRGDRATQIRSYELTLDKDGNLARYDVTVMRAGAPAGTKPSGVIAATPMPGAIHVTVTVDSTQTYHIKAPPTILPFMFNGFGMWETVVMRAVASGKDSLAVPMVFMGDTTVYTTVVTRVGKDSVRIRSELGMARAHIDAKGHILGYDAPGSTTQVVATRMPSVDVNAFAAAYASRPIGQLSKADTVRANIAGSDLMVAYSQPSVRGRVIFGGTVVPWDVIWRAGANAATTFTTSKNIMMGGTSVPAGEYTLFMVPNPTSWKLVISKKTKEWGTEYDPTMDLARVDMTVATLPAAVEVLKYSFTPAGLTLSWDKTAVSVPIH